MSSADGGFSPLEGDERLTTAILSDSCDAAGLRHQVLQDRLAPVVPGSRAIGRARTVRFAPSLADDPDDPYGDAIDVIGSIGAGQLVVIATAESNDSAFWGELFSAAALGRRRGRGGDRRQSPRHGAHRGARTSRHSRVRVGPSTSARVFASSTSTSRSCSSGVTIATGDLVMADDDGVVVVPRAHEDAVLALARERAARESTVLAELLAGETLRAVWDRHRVL